MSFVHASSGRNLWSGNSCFYSDGGRISLSSCTVHSSSGRGVVACKGATVNIHDSVIHDSAATGFYVGKDPTRSGVSGPRGKTMARVVNCAIVRNGIGGLNGGAQVPPGHSGAYVEVRMGAGWKHTGGRGGGEGS